MKKMLILIAGCILFLSGCTKSNIVAPSLAVEPETDIKEGIEIDWGQVLAGLDETFIDPDAYPMGVEIGAAIDPEVKYAQLTIQVKEETDPDDAVAYAMEVAKGLNDEVATQDFKYERSSEKSFGGFLKDYTLQVMVYPEGQYFEDDKCIMDITVQPGEYVEFTANGKSGSEK